jgi:hypothetical protein
MLLNVNGSAPPSNVCVRLRYAHAQTEHTTWLVVLALCVMMGHLVVLVSCGPVRRRCAMLMLVRRSIRVQLPQSQAFSVNFITAHDGFTLDDLVSYNDKHNDANGGDNRDGRSDNGSWNHG